MLSNFYENFSDRLNKQATKYIDRGTLLPILFSGSLNDLELINKRIEIKKKINQLKIEDVPKKSDSNLKGDKTIKNYLISSLPDQQANEWIELFQTHWYRLIDKMLELRSITQGNVSLKSSAATEEKRTADEILYSKSILLWEINALLGVFENDAPNKQTPILEFINEREEVEKVRKKIESANVRISHYLVQDLSNNRNIPHSTH